MRTVPVLAGIAALALAGFSAAALAENVHSMTVNLPGGGTERIIYTGEHAPKVVIYRGTQNPFAPAYVGWYSPFATLERISAEMKHQMDAMMRQTATMPLLAGPNRLMQAEMRHMPQGASSYSFVSTMSGSHVCTHVTRIMMDGNGTRHVEQHTSGDCSAANAQAPASLSPVPVQEQRGRTIEARSEQTPFRYSSGIVRAANYRTDN